MNTSIRFDIIIARDKNLVKEMAISPGLGVS